MTELIVLGPLLRIGKDFIGLGKLLELLFGSLVPRILVRMMLDRHLPERFLDLGISCIAVNPEHLVIITFIRQNLILCNAKSSMA